MTNSASPSPSIDLASSNEYQSIVYPGVTFTIRQMTLGHRIKLLRELHGLYREIEFGNAGDSKSERLNAQLSSLRVDEVFLRCWVLAVEGLVIDGKPVAAEGVSEFAPERLVAEMLSRIRECIALTLDEEKN